MSRERDPDDEFSEKAPAALPDLRRWLERAGLLAGGIALGVLVTVYGPYIAPDLIGGRKPLKLDPTLPLFKLRGTTYSASKLSPDEQQRLRLAVGSSREAVTALLKGAVLRLEANGKRPGVIAITDAQARAFYDGEGKGMFPGHDYETAKISIKAILGERQANQGAEKRWSELRAEGKLKLYVSPSD